MFKFVAAIGHITSLISSASTLMPVNQSLADQLAAALGVGDWTYVLLRNGSDTEVVKITSISGLTAAIVRDVDSTGAKAFPNGSSVCANLPYSAVVDIINAVGVPADLTFEGIGATTVTEEYGNVVIDTQIVTIEADENGGIEVIGEFPNFTLALTNPSGCCDDSGGGGSSGFDIVGFGLVNVELEDDTYTINVTEPEFSGDGGIEVSGSWPYYTIGFSGSVGTVTAVNVSTGLSKSGSAAAPTLYITNTGVTAGNYGGVVINAQGQFTAVPSGFNPVSVIEAEVDTGIAVDRSGHTVTISGIDAAEGVKGVVALADADAPLDPDDDTTAVTPALLANVVDALAGTDIGGVQSYTGEADASYTNAVASSAVNIDIPSGGKALVIMSATVKNPSDVTDIPEYGIALFTTAPARLQASPILKQQMQMLHAVIEGPTTATLVLATTDLTGYSLLSYSMQVIVI